MDDSQSYSWISVRLKGETIQVLTQEQSPAMPYNINDNINVWVVQHGCDSKVPGQVHPAATVDMLKAIISEHQRHLDFNLPARIFWNLFHAQKSTGLLFQLSNAIATQLDCHIFFREDYIIALGPLRWLKLVKKIAGDCILHKVRPTCIINTMKRDARVMQSFKHLHL
ncbi:hypothetical protein EV1_025786 [Malus domestica]